MNDFLKNLRSTQRASHPRHSSHTRKAESQFFPKTERRKIPDRRMASRQYDTDAASLFETLNETLPYVRENIGQIASCMERIAETRESLAKASMEQHNAISDFFKNLNQLLTQTFVPIVESAKQQNGVPSNGGDAGSSGYLSKDEVIGIIRGMRKNRATFAEIAEHLKEKGIPTFSGRGDWHAQTIHRLCK